jgi:hypothetical protein
MAVNDPKNFLKKTKQFSNVPVTKVAGQELPAKDLQTNFKSKTK